MINLLSNDEKKPVYDLLEQVADYEKEIIAIEEKMDFIQDTLDSGSEVNCEDIFTEKEVRAGSTE